MPLRFLLHGLSFGLPLYTLLFVATGPHIGWTPLISVAVIFVAVALDRVASPERRPPHENVPDWVFDAALYGHVAIQVLNLVVFTRMIAAGVTPLDFLAAAFLVGSSSAYSAIVVAHELIHRRNKRMRMLGRFLLSTVLYEHFYTEHIRGHHVRIGTEADPATARHNERLWAFILRTVPAQFKSAWRLEAKRVGDVNMGLLDRRMLRSRVFRGLVVEWGVLGLVTLALGPWVGLALMLQAAWAVLLLECVNYVEHWGLQRAEKRVRTLDSWDSEGWFTYYTLVGLSRHADHHAHASRPYQSLRHFDESPKMPFGYWGMVMSALIYDKPVIARMDAELRARKLGPYRPQEAPAAK
ncbi:MAG: alkane 1-monooxygenase [Proteobacteria bacterium]|nr:alkane 1-monooxygenase [Pseudomonadota bacterium]